MDENHIYVSLYEPHERDCYSCEEKTLWRYLDCDDCREVGKECIWVCTKCGEGEYLD
jgi:hypothetical protein